MQADTGGSQMKTVVLEKTINKISNLLQRGFGELGARVVSQYLTRNEDFIDIMMPGQKIEMIFSVVRIKQFSESTDALQEETIVFVNKIVRIIHEVGTKWEAEPAKNFGDKYLLIWKMPTGDDKGGFSAAIEQNKALKKQIEGAGGPDFNPSLEAATPANENLFNQTGKLPDVNAGLLSSGEDSVERYAQINERQKEMERDLLHKKEIVADKALISAVKIITELRRATDLQAYSRHHKIL